VKNTAITDNKNAYSSKFAMYIYRKSIHITLWKDCAVTSHQWSK